MPNLLRKLGFRFFFYSSDREEPPHVHIEKGKGRGKFWLEPLQRAYMRDFNRQDERKADKIIKQEQDNFKKRWYDYFR